MAANVAKRAIVGAFQRPTSNRAVHLRLTPRPETMAESREILTILESYGSVEMFKNLKYQEPARYGVMLAIYETEEAAHNLLRASPLRFVMSRDQPIEENSDGAGRETPSSTIESEESMSSDRMALAANTAMRQTAAQSRARAPTFRPSAFPDRQYDLLVSLATTRHRDEVDANPYNGPFSVSRQSSVQADLAKRVPLIGLSDINLKKPDKPWRVLAWERRRHEQERKTLREMFNEGADPKESGVLVS